ncbi:Lrp/AsnC family transcriptional regulator [Microbacterium radiodurans]|uniref:Lrp/AsnC family transcriptional regulator n=1 Tax=Microbacterium radiodurans TaxID=661398 RepID=A0A5J5IWH0_9MICO|nr:Lrp/AsnC family transcriptional regulator [Microbacterium radiodurans]KAA9089165.1 Lrp/AsnC family transcriptional regulator [Microbacterium radiodurans]
MQPDDLRGLDSTDRRLLAALDIDPRRSTANLADMLGLARGTVHTRLERLKAMALRANSVRIAPEMLGYFTRAYVSLELSQGALDRVVDHLRSIPEVVETVAISGREDLMCEVLARDNDHLYEIGQRILAEAGVQRTVTSIVLREHISQRVRQLL